MENKLNATGRRKEAVAQIWLSSGKGNITINGKRLDQYFPYHGLQSKVIAPLLATDMLKKYDIKVRVTGGGLSGQAGAVAHGLGRVLVGVNQELKNTLKKKGFLKRDPRMKERRKYGRRKARAKPQYSKR